jgi:hypothetical protein
MPLQPEPEQKPDAQAAPKPDAKAQARPSDSGRGPAEAYTAMPTSAPAKRKWWPLAVALGLAAASAGLGLRHHAAAPAPPPPILSSQTESVLAFTQQDYDAATTEAAKQILARDATTHELAKLDHERRAEHVNPAKPAAPSPQEQAALALAAGPQTLRDGVASGQIGFYTFHLAELTDEGGDVYDISVDGAPLMRLTTSRELKSITIPIDVSKPHTVRQTLVFARPRAVYAKNGKGGPPPEGGQASLTVQSSAGEYRGHVTTPGDSESWTTQFHGQMGSGASP